MIVWCFRHELWMKSAIGICRETLQVAPYNLESQLETARILTQWCGYSSRCAWIHCGYDANLNDVIGDYVGCSSSCVGDRQHSTFSAIAMHWSRRRRREIHNKCSAERKGSTKWLQRQPIPRERYQPSGSIVIRRMVRAVQ